MVTPFRSNPKTEKEMLYQARKWLLKNPDGDFDRYLYRTEDNSMIRSVFDRAKNESPSQRMAALNAALFKPGGTVPTIPEPSLGPPTPEVAFPTPGGIAAPAARTRKIVGKLPPRYRAAVAEGLESANDGNPAAPQPAPAPAPAPKPEATPVETKSLTVNNNNNNPESNGDDMPKRKTGKPMNPQTIKVFNDLSRVIKTGKDFPTYSQYCERYGKVPLGIYATARAKAFKEIGRPATAKTRATSAAPKGKTAMASAPGPISGGTQYQIIHVIDGPIKAEVLEGLRTHLVPILQGLGLPYALEGIEFRRISDPDQIEIRRRV